MGHEAKYSRVGWRLGTAMALVVFLCLISAFPTAAQDEPTDNFQFSYDPVSFDKSEVHGGEVFHAAIAGRATCTKDLPMSAEEAEITSRFVAVHTATGAEVILNTGYTFEIKPFPSKEGEAYEISQTVPLQFSALAETGEYEVISKTVEAKVKVLFAWVDVTGYLPQSYKMGTVTYIAPETTETPSSPSDPALPIPDGQAVLETPQSALDTSAIPEPGPSVTWWGELIVLAAIVTTVFNIVWFWRYRTRKR